MVMFEHATGYGLFRVKEFEEIAMLQSAVEESITDISAFNSVITLQAFNPFKNAEDALANINAVSEGLCTDQLKFFLQANLPKKAKKVTMGILDSKLGAAVSEAIGVKVSHIGVVPEIIRGIRLHFAKLVKGMTAEGSSKAQLGLGHAYSRAKVKFNVHKSDNMIIQSIALLDQLDKDVNTFSMRIREWYSYHFPELVKIVPDNYTFAKCVKVIKNRKEITDGAVEKLEEVIMDSAKAKAVLDASKTSMGMDISQVDLMNIEMFANRVVALAEYRKELSKYLQDKMGNVAPNLAALIGDVVGARLISHAGSLTNLAKYPASTVQILGAEKALFRALKKKGNTPKYGLIFHSSFIGRAAAKNKGRISRFLANKCTIASRIDCFSEQSNNIFGSKLKEQVEDRLKFFETGEIPKKNLDVMTEAMEAIKKEDSEFQKVSKKEKKKKKRKAEEMESEEIEEEASNEKKIKIDVAEQGDSAAAAEAVEAPKSEKKKKKKKSAEEQTQVVEEKPAEESMEVVEEAPKDPEPATTKSEKKKKKKKASEESEVVAEPEKKESVEEAPKDAEAIDNVTTVEAVETPKSEKKKKKKKKDAEEQESTNNVEAIEEAAKETEPATPKSEKKKKKKKAAEESEEQTDVAEEAPAEVEPTTEKKKKKKKKEKASDE